MLIQDAGVSVDKMTLAEEIAKVPFRYDNGLYGNPYEGFVGDIYSFDNSGYGVYHGPIADLAENYLPGKIVDLTGEDIEAIYDRIQDGSPVWVNANTWFTELPEREFITWDTQSGEIDITYREHSVIVVGYDEDSFYINDTLAEEGYTTVSKDHFEKMWIQMGKQAVSYVE